MKKPAICRILNPQRATVVCEKCVVADDFWTRGKGLMGRRQLPPDEGIWLVPGTSIHMFGVKISLDILFLTRENVVTDWVENIGPGKIYLPRAQRGKPHSALEVAPGTIARSQTQIGDRLEKQEPGDQMEGHGSQNVS